MATEFRQKSRTRITAQSSSALTAGQYPEDGSYSATSNCTTLDNTYDGGSENCLGADYVNLELDVTSAPSTAATADIYWRGSEDGGTTWTDWRYSHTVGKSIATSADRYSAGMFILKCQATQLAVASVGYNFTSVLYATPKLIEAQ